eukprot:16434982-Heterocapsa_arctica.AAC.1
MRESDAALQHVVLLKSDHTVSTTMKQRGKKYFEERNGSKNTVTMLGAPHLHVWEAMVETIVHIGTATSQKFPRTVQQDLR